MKLAFNVMNSGLGNNGGSRTILLCRKVLEELGHRCDIIGTGDNFTWFEHKPLITHIPNDLDAIIATACTTMPTTLDADVPGKAWYIRAHESWSMRDYKLKEYYNAGILNIVNSIGLQKKLANYGADSKVVYQGIDFDWWRDLKLRPENKIRIGCLHTKQPRKRWRDFVELHRILGDDKYEYVGMGNARSDDDFLMDFKLNANVEELNALYSSCHIWFAPTDSEGLHNVPMEAALCGCLVVCSDNVLNGMVLDYAFKDKTAMVYEFGKLEDAADLIRNPNWSLVREMQDCLRDVIGDREYNMKKLVEVLESD